MRFSRDYPNDDIMTAEEVIREVECERRCRIDPLALILYRKNMLTAEEFLEALGTSEFTYHVVN